MRGCFFYIADTLGLSIAIVYHTLLSSIQKGAHSIGTDFSRTWVRIEVNRFHKASLVLESCFEKICPSWSDPSWSTKMDNLLFQETSTGNEPLLSVKIFQKINAMAYVFSLYKVLKKERLSTRSSLS